MLKSVRVRSTIILDDHRVSEVKCRISRGHKTRAIKLIK